MAALIAGMVGCDYTPTPSQDLEIRTWYDLDNVRDNLVGNHILMNDLDSTTAGYEELASPTANGGKGWQPIVISDPRVGFGGTFDGQGHEIRDLFINRPDEDGIGLFRRIGGVVQNLGVMNVTVTGNNYVGGLVGSNYGTVINSYASGNVTGEDRVGILAGNSGNNVFNSYSSGNVTGSSSVGGLVGVNLGSVNSSHSTGSVIGVDHVGGLVGYSYYGTVSNSYSTGNVTGYSDVGGLVGLNGWDEHTSERRSSVGDSYSTGSVTGNEKVGGLVGCNNNGSTVSDSYSTGSVTGNMWVGGLAGWNYAGNVINSFWDTETSGQAISHGGTGKTTAEMQDIATFSGVGWNIIAVALNQTNPAYIWNIVNNVTYPFLSWEP